MCRANKVERKKKPLSLSPTKYAHRITNKQKANTLECMRMSLKKERARAKRYSVLKCA